MSSISFNLFILVNILIIPMLILSETNQYKLHFFPFNLIKHVIYFLAYSIYLCSCRIEKQPADDILHPALVSLYNVGLDYPGAAFLLVFGYTAMFVCMAYLVSRLRKCFRNNYTKVKKTTHAAVSDAFADIPPCPPSETSDEPHSVVGQYDVVRQISQV